MSIRIAHGPSHAEDDLSAPFNSELAEAVLDTVRQPLIILDEKLVVQSVNGAFHRTFEEADGEVLGRSVWELGGGQWDIEPLRAVLNTVLAEHRALTDFVIRFGETRRGQRTFRLDARQVVLGETRYRLVLVALEDVTDLLLVERERDLYERRLERSNRDLEDFAHAASHDLQEPLRKVRAFADRLERSFDDAVLTEKQTDYMTRMRDAASRMQVRIDDLLRLARVGRSEPRYERVDLRKLVASVMQDLDRAVIESESAVEVGNLPTIEGDPSQFALLFQNLIANAIKYRKPGTRARVRVTPGPADSEWVQVAVSDDGIGFDPAYAERIFRPFERLHGRDEYEGSGVGLSICRRVVELHGGSITADGEPGIGATFTIRLPAAQRKGV
ncbi:MAG: PAS domain-containing protein [Gemmatimonadetes bacterium]|nr:PAS domain-containing protein [Gemmatimonadota bacterium]